MLESPLLGLTCEESPSLTFTASLSPWALTAPGTHLAMAPRTEPMVHSVVLHTEPWTLSPPNPRSKVSAPYRVPVSHISNGFVREGPCQILGLGDSTLRLAFGRRAWPGAGRKSKWGCGRSTKPTSVEGGCSAGAGLEARENKRICPTQGLSMRGRRPRGHSCHHLFLTRSKPHHRPSCSQEEAGGSKVHRQNQDSHPSHPSTQGRVSEPTR